MSEERMEIIGHGREIRRFQFIPVVRGQFTSDDNKFQIALIHRLYGSVNSTDGLLDSIVYQFVRKDVELLADRQCLGLE